MALASAAHAADADAGKRKAEPCAECHGPGGYSTDPEVPSLAAQPPIYIYYQLLQYREQRRVNARMSPSAAKLSDAEMKDIAAYFSAQEPHVAGAPPNAPPTESGKQVASRHHCESCHRSDFAGQGHVPRIAGLQYEYLVKELRGFRNGKRPDIDGMMASSAQPLTDKDITDVAAYLAGLR